MANPDTVSGQLLAAGFERIGFQRLDAAITFGADPDEAVAAAMALGPAAETLRLAGSAADQLRPKIEADLRELATELTSADGSVRGAASAWLVSARVPLT